MDYSLFFQPVQVPDLNSDSTAAEMASWQAAFVSNIVSSANELLKATLSLKNTDFLSVGDLPMLGGWTTAVDNDFYSVLKERPAALDSGLEDLSARVDSLAALVSPTAPTLALPDAEIPTLTAVAPVITLPVAPSTEVGELPSGAPSLESAPIPEAPTIVIPPAPTLEDLQLPMPPSFTLPSFDSAAPQNLLSSPTAEFDYVDQGYASPFHDRLVVKLINDLDNGTYGIEPADEDALWSRARDRAAQQARAGVDEAMRRAASTSFPMPPGFMFEQAEEAEQKGQQSLSEMNREIALKRSELYVEGRKFTIQQCKEYEQIRINLYHATEERSLNYAKAKVELAISVYDASVRNFMSKMEAYKVEADVFRTKMQAELVKAQIFESQVKAESLRVEFNRARIEAYNALLQGITTTVELYKARIYAATLFMQLQSQRLELYRSQIQTFAERVKAKEAEYGLYRAQTAGELAKLDVYKAQIEAHNGQLQAVETRGKIQLQGNESLLQSYRVAVQQYTNQLESFKAQVSALVEEARTRGQMYNYEVDAYRAFTAAATAGARINVDGNSQMLDWAKIDLGTKIARVEHRFKQLNASVELNKSVNMGGVDYFRSLLGATASGLNALGVKTQEG